MKAITPSQIHSIQDVIDMLDEIIESCTQNQSGIGYFASLYKTVSINIKKAIENKTFEDNSRMEKLNIAFAYRYFDAYHAYMNGQVMTQSWRNTFEASKDNRLTVLQQLLLAINTHINLDLAIAVSTITTSVSIHTLANDFNKMNTIICDSYKDILPKLNQTSRGLAFIRKISPYLADKIVIWTIKVIRKRAWSDAVHLTMVEDRDTVIGRTDSSISRIGRIIIDPGVVLTALIRMIRLSESGDAKHNLSLLEARICPDNGPYRDINNSNN